MKKGRKEGRISGKTYRQLHALANFFTYFSQSSNLSTDTIFAHNHANIRFGVWEIESFPRRTGIRGLTNKAVLKRKK